MSLILAMTVVTLVAALGLSRPWWWPVAEARLQRRGANVAAYRERLAEIDRELEAGGLDAESAAQLRSEAGARLLGETAGAEPVPVAPRRQLVALVPAVGFVALFAGLGYYVSDSWRELQLIETARQDPVAGQALMVQAMVEKLERRLSAQPEDVEGWAMLGRSYFVMDRYADAAQAYGKANAASQAQPNADWLVGEGEALALAKDRDLSGRPQQLFTQALALDPGQGKALWYAGLAAAQSGDYSTALDHWLRLRQQELPDDLAQVLDQRLPELARLAGRDLPTAPAPSALALQVDVSLDSALADRLQPGMTLFVFAKAQEGPPMPLAVQRIDQPRLPLQVRLDDRLAMMPSLKLSQFDRWVVTARLSGAGSVQPQAGDLEGSRVVGRGEATGPLRLVIDRVLP